MKSYITISEDDVNGIIEEIAEANGVDLTDEQVDEIRQGIYSDVMDNLSIESAIGDATEAYLEDNDYYEDND